MKKIFTLIALFIFIFVVGYFKQINTNNMSPENTDDGSQKVDINEKCKNYNFVCKKDSDCSSVSKLTSCYDGNCDEKYYNCDSISKCCVINKYQPYPNKDLSMKICEVSIPCLEPIKVKCVNNICMGEW